MPLSSARQKNPHLGEEIFHGWSKQFEGHSQLYRARDGWSPRQLFIKLKVNYIELQIDGVLDKCTYKTHAVSDSLASQATPLLSQAVLKLTTTIGAGLGIKR